MARCVLADFKLTDMDEWPDSDEGEEDESGEDVEDAEDRKKKKKRDTKGKGCFWMNTVFRMVQMAA